MEYYNLLHLKKEPFSNSPDPDLFFHSHQHQNCLQKLEIALRLRRGLSVVIGDIGTGKSTLSRQLMRMIGGDNEKIISHLILDPEFTSPKEFLKTIAKTFNISITDEDSEWQMKEDIKTYLFKQGVDLDMIPALIIDEGQKLPDFCIEILREFLNFETNQYKLLQIIIFAQEEFKEVLKKKANFADRITTLQHLAPLNFKETKQMIRFRIEKTQNDPKEKLHLFSPTAFLGVYFISGGYPRKIVMLCSKVIFNLLVKNKKQAGLRLVLASARETSTPAPGSFSRVTAGLLVLLLASTYLYFNYDKNFVTSILKHQLDQKTTTKEPSFIARKSDKKTIPKKQTSPGNDPITIVPPSPEVQIEETFFQPPPIHIEPTQKKQSIDTFLGTLQVPERETLELILSRVYGIFSEEILEAVLAKNLHIQNPREVLTNTTVTLPVITAARPLAMDDFSVQLASNQTLEQAYVFLQNYPAAAPGLQLNPVWTENPTASFSITLKENFTDQKQAEERMVSLPEQYRQEAVLVSTQNLQRTEEEQQTHSTPANESTSYINSHPGRFPEVSTRLLEETELIKLDSTDLKIMRNEVFARHSYIFTSEEMKRYFDKQSWYTGTYKKVSDKLSKIELENLDTLRRYEKRRNINQTLLD